MADEVTDEDLQNLRDHAEELREQIAESEAQRAERVAAENRKIEAAQLAAEVTRLEAQLARNQEASQASNVKEGSIGPLAQAQAQLEAAQALRNAPVGPVDTNATAEAPEQSEGTGENAGSDDDALGGYAVSGDKNEE